jgi:hypothetical protein
MCVCVYENKWLGHTIVVNCSRGGGGWGRWDVHSFCPMSAGHNSLDMKFHWGACIRYAYTFVDRTGLPTLSSVRACDWPVFAKCLRDQTHHPDNFSMASALKTQLAHHSNFRYQPTALRNVRTQKETTLAGTLGSLWIDTFYFTPLALKFKIRALFGAVLFMRVKF